MMHQRLSAGIHKRGSMHMLRHPSAGGRRRPLHHSEPARSRLDPVDDALSAGDTQTLRAHAQSTGPACIGGALIIKPGRVAPTKHRFNTRTTAASTFFCPFSAIRCDICRSKARRGAVGRNFGGQPRRNFGGQLFRTSNSQGIQPFPRPKEAGLSAIIP